MRGTRLIYEKKLEGLREMIVRTIAPDKIPHLLEDLAETDWQSLASSFRVRWQTCIFCGTSFRLMRPDGIQLYCASCSTEEFKREALRVSMQCTRARASGCPATLTLTEWFETLDDFERKCAYCDTPYSEMEHFIPITQQGGTTKDNCIPTCHTCNMRKENLHPDEVTRLPREVVERVAHYLSQFKNAATA